VSYVAVAIIKNRGSMLEMRVLLIILTNVKSLGLLLGRMAKAHLVLFVLNHRRTLVPLCDIVRWMSIILKCLNSLLLENLQ
jgi:hypothetical protein